MRRPSAVALACVVLVAAAHAQDAAEQWGRPVTAIRFDATARIDPRSLRRELLPLQVGKPLTSQDLQESVRLLELKGLWSSVDPEVIPNPSGVEVVFHLVRKIFVNSVDVEGNDHFWKANLLKRLRLPVGSEADDETLHAAADRLRELYHRDGYLDAQIDYRIERRDKGWREVNVTYVIRENEPTVVGAIVIEGTPVFSAEEVRDATGVDIGDPYKRDTERQARKNVIAMYRDKDYYTAAVDSDWQLPAGSRSGTLVLNVRAGPPYELVFRGNHAMSRGDILDLINLKNRPIVTDGTWRTLAQKAKRAYQQRGYYRADVKLIINDDETPEVVELDVDEGEQFFIDEIDISGNDVVPDSRLREVMQTAPRSWHGLVSSGALADDTLREDLSNIWFLYRRLGFQSAQVVDSRTQFDEENGTITLTIVIEEGPRSIVEDLTFDDFTQGFEIPKLKTQVGEPYSPQAVEDDTSQLTLALARLGYPDAEVNDTVDEVRSGGIVETKVHFVAAPGEYKQLGPVVVENNQLTLDRIILRELDFKEGDPYNAEGLLQGQANVYKLGLFRRVTVRPVEDVGPPLPDAKPAPIAVRVEEREPGSIQYGFGYNTELGLRLFTEASYDNLFGTARKISLRAEMNLSPTGFTPDEYLSNLGFREPRLLGSDWVSQSNFILQRSVREIQRYSIERQALLTSLQRELLPALTVGGELQLDQSTVFDVPLEVATDPRLVLGRVPDQGFLRTITFGPLLTFDRRNDPFNPTTGYIESVKLRYTVPGISGVDFLKLTTQHAQFIPLIDDLTFVYSLRTGWARPLDGRLTVPIRERFFLGGRTTVRGFSENSIGPVGGGALPPGNRPAEREPLGGDLSLNVNTELRFPLVFGFSGVTFADGGGLYLQNGPISVHDFRRSAGLGLRYATPVGPISLEYGFKLDRRSGESIGAVHFTIGAIF